MVTVAAADYRYDDRTVIGFVLSTLVWGVVGLLVGLLIATQIFAPSWNLAPYLTYGRLRPVHTNVLALGMGGGAIFGLTYYMTMRLCRRALVFPRLARAHLWIFNVGILAAAVTLAMGYTQTLEYAELEWPLDIVVVVMWVMFGVNVFATVLRRREEQMYVALWYALATVIAVAVLYLVENLVVPAGLMKGYHLFAGVNSANVQWWYGHNVVGFLFTTPILAMFYYFLPKSTGLPHLQPPPLHRRLLVAHLRLPLDRRAPPHLHAGARPGCRPWPSSSPSSSSRPRGARW